MADASAPVSQINITLGTAGHIDHGKTALIRLLTGCETDRLKEEKQRGMSIELGFAPCVLGDLEVGIVDVPGHENFIKTMVAGATGIDGVIFVVAADDGIMPQTREHLDILTLLGVRHGMVALTKSDLAGPERVEQVREELRAFLRGTFLEGAAICPMSSVTGEGFDGFYDELKGLLGRLKPRTTEGVFRMPVERAFSIKGFGTVVSGIPVSGSVQVGEELVLLPPGAASRIKSAQVYGKPATTAQSGQCAAMNLPQLDYKLVERGQVLTRKGYFESAQWFLCELTVLESFEQPLKNGAKVKVHTGTSEVTASLYSLEAQAAQAGRTNYIQVRTDHLIVAGPGDRFILRLPAPARTIGGGCIVESLERKLKRSHLDFERDVLQRAAAVRSPEAFAEYAVRTASGGAAKSAQIAFRIKQTPERTGAILQALLERQVIAELSDRLYVHARTQERLAADLLRRLEERHTQQPQSPGMEPGELMEQSGLSKELFDGLLERLRGEGKVVLRKDRLALPTHREQLEPGLQALVEQVEGCFRRDLFSPPALGEVAATIRRPEAQVKQAVKLLVEHQRLVYVSADMIFHTQAIEEARTRIAGHIRGEGQGRLESVAFKYLVDTTRKYALPLLDYMDKIGFTRRVGNTRYLKSP